ncbi:MAG: DUF488 domain-containing protein [Dehalococcoidia bacterium]
MILYTIGHSTTAIGDFISALRAHDIGVLVDVRSRPRSRWPQFNQQPLARSVEDAGIRYVHMGDRLGGMPRDPDAASRWRAGRLDPRIIDHLRSTEAWREGLRDLTELVRQPPAVCIMCSERDPAACHRCAVALDVADLLPGLDIVHVSTSNAPIAEPSVQQTLF